jgi:hypothetical protein
MAVTVYCQFEGDGVEFLEGDYWDSDIQEKLAELLAEVRSDLIKGDTSFLSAVAEFYHASEEDEDESSDDRDNPPAAKLDEMSKAELQEECERRGMEYKKSWTKAQLREALVPKRPARPRSKAGTRPHKLSRAARTIVDQLVNL